MKHPSGISSYHSPDMVLGGFAHKIRTLQYTLVSFSLSSRSILSFHSLYRSSVCAILKQLIRIYTFIIMIIIIIIILIVVVSSLLLFIIIYYFFVIPCSAPYHLNAILTILFFNAAFGFFFCCKTCVSFLRT